MGHGMHVYPERIGFGLTADTAQTSQILLPRQRGDAVTRYGFVVSLVLFRGVVRSVAV